MPTKPKSDVLVGDWLTTASLRLTKAGIDSPRIDCLLFLEDTLHMDRAHLLAHPERRLTPHQLHQLTQFINKRSTHQPMAYIRGMAPFYGRNFVINESVLVPRPESEAMIELTLELIAESQPVVVDIGTGSGALGITMALERRCTVQATDISPAALRVAKDNASRHQATITFHHENLLGADLGPVDVILANLPYVPEGYSINKAATFEPKLAIFGGADGLDVYRELFSQLKSVPWSAQFVLTEALLSQHQRLEEIANAHGFSIVKTRGLCQAWRPTSSVRQPR